MSKWLTRPREARGLWRRLLLRRRRLHELLAGVAARPRRHRHRDRHAVHVAPDHHGDRHALGRLDRPSAGRPARRHRGTGHRGRRDDGRLPVLLFVPGDLRRHHDLGLPVVAAHAALRRRAGDRDQEARPRLCARAHVELGRLHRRHLPRRHRRRPLRPALGALCRHGEHRAAGAAARCCCRPHAAARRRRRARPRAVQRRRACCASRPSSCSCWPAASARPATPCSTASAR